MLIYGEWGGWGPRHYSYDLHCDLCPVYPGQKGQYLKKNTCLINLEQLKGEGMGNKALIC